MAHWAEIDENKIVIRVLVGDNDDPAGDEGYSWLVNNLGGTWVETSYNATIRKNFAGVGFSYDLELDAFIRPKPFDSWTLNAECDWEAPTPRPDVGNHNWNESTLSWVEITGE